MTETLIPINIVIGDRTYRIKIAPQDEGQVRATLKLVNEKILTFKTEFAGKDMQDYIAMVLIWLATEQQRDVKDTVQLYQFENTIAKLNAQIDKLLT
ncbi:MAG: cell division protein ZapA [Chitinophagaceae bacterium]|jgi:cell division protein ZapA|nr:cell division protein ZapA [Chitinophagaceae bacterium]